MNINQAGILIEAFGSGGVQYPDSPVSQQLLWRRGPPTGRLEGFHSRGGGSSTLHLKISGLLIQTITGLKDSYLHP